VANEIDAGMVYVNIVGADGAELPFGRRQALRLGGASWASTARTSSSTRS
jgi:acyl-CoA reductase-like NAD-dependent aldehyde dehydrogenase